jgi:hypothetical protein
MSEENTLTRAQVNKRMMEDNKELSRIIASALYPADIQRYFLRKARNEIKNMGTEDRESFAFKVQEEVLEWEEKHITLKSY